MCCHHQSHEVHDKNIELFTFFLHRKAFISTVNKNIAENKTKSYEPWRKALRERPLGGNLWGRKPCSLANVQGRL